MLRELWRAVVVEGGIEVRRRHALPHRPAPYPRPPPSSRRSPPRSPPPCRSAPTPPSPSCCSAPGHPRRPRHRRDPGRRAVALLGQLLPVLRRGRWAWLAVWRVLPGARDAVRAAGSLVHGNHAAKPDRPRLGLVVPSRGGRVGVAGRGGAAGAAPDRARHQRQAHERPSSCACSAGCGSCSTLGSCARLIEAAIADGHTVVSRARRDLALHAAAVAGRVSTTRGRRGRVSTRCRSTKARGSCRASSGSRGAESAGWRPAYSRAGWCLPCGCGWGGRPPRRGGRGAPAGLHRSGRARDRGYHELRQEVRRRALEPV